MKQLVRVVAFFGVTLLAITSACATPITVSWEPDAILDGTGTGQLGPITVTYSTVVGLGNAGLSLTTDWNTALASDAVGASNNSAGIIGSTDTLSPQIQTINFSGTVEDPILYFNFGQLGDSFDFGALSFSLLDSYNAKEVPNGVEMTDGSNSANDGFVVQILGTFAPSSPLEFTYSTTRPFDSFAFTVSATIVPEPSTMLLFASGLVAMLPRALRFRRSR